MENVKKICKNCIRCVCSDVFQDSEPDYESQSYVPTGTPVATFICENTNEVVDEERHFCDSFATE